MPSFWIRLLAMLAAHGQPVGANRLRMKLPGHIDPTSDSLSPLAHVEDIADPVEDIELRQKPPHVPPEDVAAGSLMVGDLADLLNENRDDMRDCVIIHQYAEPLQVGDAVRELEVGVCENNCTGENATREIPPLVKQGAVWDDGAGNNSLPLAIEMFAQLQGITGMVQVIPHGPMAKWTSKEKVPIGGFLCSHNDQAASAPVLHATPTPCVPTALDSSGKALDPVEDGYEVFIGTTRLHFDTKAQAYTFCVKYTMKIASDLSRTVWDASSLGEFLPQKNPNVTSFVAQTGKATAPSGWTKGRKKLLVVVMDWKAGDQTLAPYSQQEANAVGRYEQVIFPAVNRAFEKMSYGQFGLDVTVVPQVIHYNRERNRYSARKMPFPALYDAARDSLEGQRSDYAFSSYDLVYVVAPQVRPTGTKGVAWVGAKGAMCNGCETISDNFKIMVAVHELGHNLGLMHASSTSLEYGNPFDWMGNYPDVVGLNYGVGYVLSLGWLPITAIYSVTDQNLPGLSAEVTITPHDTEKPPGTGEVSGVKVSLADNARDLWISYRSSPDGGRAGVFLTQQEKTEANSELIDAGCHSPSQQDAGLRVGWIYLDKSHRVAVKVNEVTESYAKVHIFAVGPSDVPKIYGQPTFTDGETKCPVTCQDANWLVTSYNCPDLRARGLCDGGALTLQGTKYSIGLEICPQECGKCDQVMSSTKTTIGGGCSDRNMKISGKSCREAAASGWCSYETRSGSSVGQDLCPVSCGQCPKTVTPSSAPFSPPPVTQAVGGGVAAPATPSSYVRLGNGQVTILDGDDEIPGPMPMPAPAPMPAPEVADDDDDEEDACEDDPSWKDAQGDSCQEYTKVIEAGTWTQKQACNYSEGAPRLFCRKTCDTCNVSNGTCADSTCIGTFKAATGRCEQCSDFARYCTGESASWFRIECPLTCGVCQPSVGALAAAPLSSLSPAAIVGPSAPQIQLKNFTCEDDTCITAWKVGNKCPTCSELGDSFCSESEFAMACKETCKFCIDGPLDVTCKDVFSSFTCSRYKSYGWCTREDMRGPVLRQCPLTCGVCDQKAANGTKEEPESRVKTDDLPKGKSKPARSGAPSGGKTVVALAFSVAMSLLVQ